MIIARASLLLVALSALVACQRAPSDGWLGYADADTAMIAPPQAGWIGRVAVARGAEVKEGDVLFTLDTTAQAAAAQNAAAQIAAAKAQAAQALAVGAQAKAQEAQADAQIVQNQKELARQQGLLRIGGTPQRDVEQAQAAYESSRATRNQTLAQQSAAAAQKSQAEAQAGQARANLTTAEFNLSERTVRARVAGQVQDVFFHQGEYASAGTPVIAILPPGSIYVRFFVPEADLQRLKLGNRVHIGCDGCPPNLTAAVSFIASGAEFTPPIIYSVANRQKLVFKVEARAPGGLPLRPGLPVNVTPAP